MDNVNSDINEKYYSKVKDIKAALLDIILIENKKLESLEKQLALEIDSEKQKQLENEYKKSADTIDEIVDNINNLIDNIDRLNEINETIAMAQTTGKTVVKKIDDYDIQQAFNSQLEDMKEKKQDVSNEISQAIESNDILKENEQEIKEDMAIINEGINITNESSDSDDLTPSEEKTEENLLKDINNQENLVKEQQEIIEEQLKDSSDKDQEQLLSFQKTTKIVTKAILVRQDQLTKLKASRAKQKQIITAMGIFNGYRYMVPVVNKMNDTLQNEKLKEQTLAQEMGLNDENYQDVERQIEDLMVKANIYSSEGETEKAENLYNKINELSVKLDKNPVKEKINKDL